MAEWEIIGGPDSEHFTFQFSQTYMYKICMRIEKKTVSLS